MRRFGLGLLAAFAVNAAALAQDSGPRTFSDVAAESFEEWDADDDGTLSAPGIDRMVVSPRFKGEHGAALAAMKLVLRSTKIAPPPLTLDFVQNHSRDPAGELLPSEHQDLPEPRLNTGPSTRKPLTPPRPPASLERRYQSALRKIRAAQTELFADGTPDLERCRQGPLGSCFFIAGVGAFVHRDPESLKAMFRTVTSESGAVSFAVSFGDGRSVTIPALTDAQRGLTSSAGSDGLWLTVLEHAYGALRMQSRPESRRSLEPSDALARGGSLSTTLRVLTGHAVDRLRLRTNVDKDPELVDKVRAALKEALQAKRLAGATTGTAELPPGINGKHAYAVLGYDQLSDSLELWNPHGNSFRPKGEAGRERGYETRRGLFTIPLTDFVHVFDSLAIESDRPAEGGRG
jgi:hypothetical protein